MDVDVDVNLSFTIAEGGNWVQLVESIDRRGQALGIRT